MLEPTHSEGVVGIPAFPAAISVAVAVVAFLAILTGISEASAALLKGGLSMSLSHFVGRRGTRLRGRESSNRSDDEGESHNY